LLLADKQASRPSARLTIAIERCGEGCEHSDAANALEPAGTLPNAQVIKLGPHEKSFACILDNLGVSLLLLHFDSIGVDVNVVKKAPTWT
jgi:hypothetical protein